VVNRLGVLFAVARYAGSASIASDNF